MRKELPTQTYLEECFNYDSLTGSLIWKIRPLHHFVNKHRMKNTNSRFSGKVTGCKNRDGYLQINIKQKLYMVHHIIWKMHYGVDPEKEIDHINGIPYDNRIENLRLATRQENMRNRGYQINSSTKSKGVTAYKGRYRVRIVCGSKRKHIGYYNTLEEATKVYQEYEKLYYGEFRRIENI